MPVSVKVNGMMKSLVHKGSNGFSAATIPDVCKTPTPGGPVPMPYPNVTQSISLAKGTTTVKADGMMAAIKGSEFSLSNGDQPGTLGGVKSSTFMKESTWILYSFDVKMDGKNACRMGDKKFQNHENTVDLMGEGQGAVTVDDLVAEVKKAACKCQKDTKPKTAPKTKKARQNQCQKLIDKRGACVTKALNGRESEGIWPNARYPDPNPDPDLRKTRITPDVSITTPGNFPSSTTSVGKRRRAVKAKLKAGNVEKIVDFKFPCPPAFVEPYPDATPRTLGYGPKVRAGPKELNEYSTLTTPEGEVETFTPSTAGCP